MDERVIQFRVGVVVLSAGLITGILIFIFGEGWKPRYTLYADYVTAPGVSMNTPVRKNGILIGRVMKVDLQEAGVQLTLKIDSDITVYSNEVCTIKPATLIGDPILEFTPGTVQARGVALQDGDRVTATSVEADPFERIDTRMEEAVTSISGVTGTAEQTLESFNSFMNKMNNDIAPEFDSTVRNINQITGSLRDALDGENADIRGFFDDIRRLTSATEAAVAKFDSVMANVNDIVGDDIVKSNIKESLASFPTLVQKAERTLDEAQSSMESFRAAADSAQANLDNLQGFTGPLNERGEQMVVDLQQSLQSVSEMAEQLESFTRTLNESEGTLGLLLNDPQLYQEFLSAVRNVEALTQTFRPVMRDLRVATDKIARDPSQLGVRGVFKQGPVGSGTKGGLLSPSYNGLR